ncbi:5-(carboxyamino)imidazole ribonucleotide mutase [Alkalilimnicola ehrlichii MLHE-1]|uniref:N5-carboxyaminoimidazole ribonucleotide mutase n=1 Tax=Alkalilimnicola ehrlichii (strain ATCC BAA-1101 / DSM 17681 / MLHE-1) TaxID=187272 RepID=Q0A6F8_ALKEH|nr:5-(carboxyamino)imidazole ribonucleotide mutase [Alkalilimnicola ehrlichii]ABI57579.1 5-(carboxyamino)imidazole ribonucleotide mutase [Alkalilimnicola ehrlichii MLHE-1]
MSESQPLVGVIMGSRSDWETMSEACQVLDDFQVPYEARIVSAHRTPELMRDYAHQAEERGLKAIIAGAGGAAHLPGMVAAMTTVPVLGVPVQSRALKGLDSLLSIVQMPGGVPVATLAIGSAGARNAGLLACSILANEDAGLRERLRAFRERQAQKVLEDELPQ